MTKPNAPSLLGGVVPATLSARKSGSQCAVERRAFLVGANPTQQLSFRLVAARAVHGGNDMD